MDAGIYNGQGIVHPMFTKRIMIMALRESAFCVVEESNEKQTVRKIGMAIEHWMLVKIINLKRLSCRISTEQRIIFIKNITEEIFGCC